LTYVSCVDSLTKVHDRKIFLILPASLAESLLPLIHDVPQLDSIYIFHDDKALHKKWKKIRGNFNNISLMCLQLQRNIRLCDETLMPITIISQMSTINLNEIEPSFMHTQLLKEILIEMNHDDTAKELFVNFPRSFYGDNKIQLQAINEFKRSYEHHSPI